MDGNDLARQVYERKRQEREDAMTVLREAVKASPWTYKQIAQCFAVTPGWIGVILRGGYPNYGANILPKYLLIWLRDTGFEVPDYLNVFP